jgi:hypothetical protein
MKTANLILAPFTRVDLHSPLHFLDRTLQPHKDRPRDYRKTDAVPGSEPALQDRHDVSVVQAVPDMNQQTRLGGGPAGRGQFVQ